jgi:2-keto-4-pentenoate hydratase/2-oxohepta-3-ene-1,7-dioic acid hydratase in catechol pathway/6-phosphogluconolactonase (cycloisomerase 2 family)
MVKFCSFKLSTSSTGAYFGAFHPNDEQKIIDLTNAIDGVFTLQQAIESDSSLKPFKDLVTTNTSLPIYNLHDVQLLPPILKPEKVLCVGMNYREHCEEQNFPIPDEPVIFNKFGSSVTGPNSNVYYNGNQTQQMDFEVELAVIIGLGGKDIKEENALKHVAGVTVAHDVSSRDWQFQKNGGQWLLGKCQDTFCPLGPSLVTLDEVSDLNNLRLTTKLNGNIVQDGNTSEFIFNIPCIISWITQFITLSPGDVILTGTPSGVGCFRKPPLWLQHGDVVECEIENIGILRNLMVDKSKIDTVVGETKSNETALKEGYVPMYVGTYTENKGFVDGKGKGIYPCALHSKTGEMKLLGNPMITSNPTFLCKSKDGNNLYTVSEDSTMNRGQLSGSTRSWNVGTKSGNDSDCNNGVLISSFASGGTDSCYIELNNAETFAFVSNYTSGSVAVFPIRPDRSLGPLCSFVQHETKKILPGPVDDRQDGPHAHQTRYHENGNWLYVPDLGLDQIIQYNVNTANGTLSEIGRFDTPPGGGPRHMDWFNQRDQYVYVTMEMGNEICFYERNESNGELTSLLQTVSSLPSDCTMVYPDNSTAQLLVHPSGNFVYVSNRGHDSIGCYSINCANGTLTPVGWYSSHGDCPRNFCFTEDGSICIVANQNSDDIYTYQVDTSTGALVDTGHSLRVPSPVCICL